MPWSIRLRPLLIAAVLLFAGLLAVPSTPASAVPSTIPPLRIASYNVCGNHTCQSKLDRGPWADSLVQAVSQSDTDVLMMQELCKGQLDALQSRLPGYVAVWTPAIKGLKGCGKWNDPPSAAGDFGLGMLVRAAAVEQHEALLPLAVPDGEVRPVQCATALLAGRTAQVCNTHLSSELVGHGTAEVVSKARQWAAGVPVVVGGDFNADPQDPKLNVFYQLQGGTGNFTEFDETDTDYFTPACQGQTTCRTGQTTTLPAPGKPARKFDYLFADTTHFQPVQGDVADVLRDGTSLSDHKMLRATLYWKHEQVDTGLAQGPGWKTQALVQAGSSLYQAVRLSDGSWTGYTDVQAKAGNLGGIRSSAAAGMNGDTHVLAISNSGGLFHSIRKADGTWIGFGDVFSVANALGNLTQVSVVNIGYDLHVVAVADGKVFHTVRYANGTWAKFGDLAGVAGPIGTATSVAVASTGGQLQVTAITGGKAYHTLRNTTGHWTGWGDVAGAVGASGPITSVSMAGVGNDAHIVIATDNGTRQYHAIRNANGTWTPLGDLKDILGTVTAKSVSAATVNGEIQVAVTTTNGKLLHTTRHTNRTWDRPSTVPLQGLPTAPGNLAITATYNN